MLQKKGPGSAAACTAGVELEGLVLCSDKDRASDPQYPKKELCKL